MEKRLRFERVEHHVFEHREIYRCNPVRRKYFNPSIDIKVDWSSEVLLIEHLDSSLDPLQVLTKENLTVYCPVLGTRVA